MLDGENPDAVATILEPNAIVANAEPQFGRIDPLQPFDGAFFGCNEARQAVQDIQRGMLIRGMLINEAHVGLVLIGPGKLLRQR